MISNREITSSFSNPQPQRKSLLSLDVSALLIHNSLLQQDGHESVRESAVEPREGLDNVAFDLEGLEKVQPGSRKPLVALHVRTVSAEEFVRSTLSNKSSHLRNQREWRGLAHYSSTTPIFSNTKDGGKSVHRHFSGNPPDKDMRGVSLSLSSEIEDERHPHHHETHHYHHNSNNHTTKFPSFKEFKSGPLIDRQKENGAEVRGNNNNDDCSNDLNEKNQQQKLVTNNKKEANFPLSQGQPLNIGRQESLPSNEIQNEKKTDTTLLAKKTGGGLTLSGRESDGTSLAKTMVRVGGVSAAISPPFTPNAVVSSPLKVVISSVGPKTPHTNVSQVSVMSGGVVGVNATITKVSNVVLNHGSGGGLLHLSAPTTSTLAPSVVSALSKVSSVRIIPSPNTTPTPSVIGVSTSSGTVPPEEGGTGSTAPTSTTISTSTTSIVTTTNNKSSHSCRPLEVVKRRIINNIRNHDQLPQQPSSLIANTANQRTSTHQSDSDQRRPPLQQEQQHLLLDRSQPGSATSQTTSDPNQAANQNASRRQPPQPSDLILQLPLLRSEGTQLQQTQQQEQLTSPQDNQSPPDPLRGSGEPPEQGGTNTQGNGPWSQVPENTRREGRERRRERRERRRERRALRILGGPVGPQGVPVQTDLGPEPRPLPHHHLPDLLNSHIPPPYSTLPNGPRSLGGLLGPPPNVGAPPPMSLQMPPPPPPVPPLPPLGPFPPPTGATHGSPVRPPIPDNPWHFFGSRRSRGSRRVPSRLGEEEAKSCCGLLVTQAVSIRWFIIMISFVGLCCTVVGTVLGAVKTNNSEYVTITLLMIGVGIVLITVSGVAWHLTSRDAPCRVMLGLAPNDSGRGETRRFMSRMAPTFGRPHHPYAAMMYPEFQYRPPPPSYQASMQEYRLRLFLLDRHGTQQFPGANTLPSPPPTYRSGPYNIRGIPSVVDRRFHTLFSRRMGGGTLSRESDYSRPPSYRSREGSVTHHPDAPPSIDPGGGVTPEHSRDPSCLSFLSHEGSTRLRGDSHKGSPSGTATKFTVVESGTGHQGDPSDGPAPTSSKKGEKGGSSPSKDDNTVTIVQTTDCSHVIGSESVIVTVSGNELTNQRVSCNNGTEISVLAHL